MGMNEKLHSWTTLLAKLNEIGGRHGVSQIDISEKLCHENEIKGGIWNPSFHYIYTCYPGAGIIVYQSRKHVIKRLPFIKYVKVVYVGWWFDSL